MQISAHHCAWRKAFILHKLELPSYFRVTFGTVRGAVHSRYCRYFEILHKGNQMQRSSRNRVFLAIVLGVYGAVTAAAQTQVVYNSIPKPLPGNVGSEGPEAYAFTEIGDGLGLKNLG